ncbi:ammonium transporter [Actinobacteria bacterium YIM 96077]|uniref:Ammonium transporter n=1 Tax=Phytoactinopolyspora halophila TaxID=1981511 RepID=A0A329QZQ9_9ACTN|nr:ammonium transporter [Phytoactinopolyspora halophila]AYY11673.1 ammonium transporter [Actinobacteria bacterium YIM 96077]RAW17894.1 ammonia channel protein [Phytoactinopolyspora halophila]
MDTGDTAWILISTALVMLMTPGLALFYGGMVRAKSVINMMMMCFGALGVVSILWIIYGYSIAYGDSQGGLLGNPGDFFGMSGMMNDIGGTIPVLVDVGFQGMFAVITVALIAGSIADRANFWTWLVFAAIWMTVVYAPVAHWVWGDGGWIIDGLEAIDFAGGTAVHINAGAAGLALALVLGRRRDWGKGSHRPHNLPLVMIGAGLLWFGWFGFNGGSAYAADAAAGVAILNTIGATAAALLFWIIVEKIRDGLATSLGAASGVVAGLVAITPAAGAVNPVGAILIGAAAGVLCSLTVSLKFRLRYDDSLDVVAVHLVGGLVGTVAIGFFATADAPDGVNGLFFGGGVELLGRQVVSVAAVVAFSFVVTYIIGMILQKTIGFRVDDDHEIVGVDKVHHGESSYEITSDDIPSDVLARVENDSTAQAAATTKPSTASSPASSSPAGRRIDHGDGEANPATT